MVITTASAFYSASAFHVAARTPIVRRRVLSNRFIPFFPNGSRSVQRTERRPARPEDGLTASREDALVHGAPRFHANTRRRTRAQSLEAKRRACVVTNSGWEERIRF